MPKIVPEPNSKVAQELVHKGQYWKAAVLEALRLTPRLLVAIGFVVAAIHFHESPALPKISVFTMGSK